MILVALTTGEPILQPFSGYHNEGSISFSPTQFIPFTSLCLAQQAKKLHFSE